MCKKQCDKMHCAKLQSTVASLKVSVQLLVHMQSHSSKVHGSMSSDDVLCVTVITIK